MNGNGEDKPSRLQAILPPVITRRRGFRSSSSNQTAPIAPPFIAGQKSKRVELPAEVQPPIEATPKEEPSDVMPWDAMPDEGVVEPVFQADTDAVLEELTQHAAHIVNKEEFPLDAFIVPEQTQSVPAGLDNTPTALPDSTPLSSLAERLEKLSHKLRVEDTDAIIRRLASGDRLDTLVAGLIAGYLAGSGEHKS